MGWLGRTALRHSRTTPVAPSRLADATPVRACVPPFGWMAADTLLARVEASRS